MLIHIDVSYQRCQSLELPGLSTIWIRAGMRQQRKILIHGFYRQWRRLNDVQGDSHLVSRQRERLQDLLKPWKDLANTDLEIISIGDINLPDEDHSAHTIYEKKLSPLVEEYSKVILSSSMNRIKTSFTRQMSGTKDTTPDQIHVTHPSKVTDPVIIHTGDSDHSLVMITRHTRKPILTPRYRKSRSYKDLQIEDFKAEVLKDHRYLASIIETDTNNVAKHLQSLLKDKLDQAAPERTIQVSSKSQHELSQETRLLMKQRDTTRDTARSSDDPEDWRSYRNLRNQVTKQIHKEYKDQDQKHLNPQTNSPTQLWKNAKILTGMEQRTSPRRLLHNGYHYDKPREMANILNKEYVTRAEAIIADIPVSPIDPMINYHRMLQGRHLEMKLSTITMAELKKILRMMRPTRSSAEDSISMKLIKEAQQVLHKPLLNLVNTSILTNTFPEDLKLAKIIPILKNLKDPSQPKSWRPINILPSLSKIIEKVVVEQLKKHLSDNALVPANHTGSRSRNSTTTAALTLHDMWVSILDNDTEAVVIQLDQSAAYDIISHTILQKKLKALGLDKNTMSWFSSYMRDRRQKVHLEATTSEECHVGQRSVIQGSTLSCLLYLIYILDMPSTFHIKPHSPLQDSKCEHPSTHTYVDDFNTTVKTPKNNPNKMNTQIQENLKKTQEYMDSNKLALNREKTKIFLITKHPDRKSQVKLNVNDKIIQHTKTINILGICFNEKLTWDNHISVGERSLAQQIRQRLIALRTISRTTSRNFTKIVATGLIMSRIEYAAALWGTAPKIKTDLIQKLSNKAARIALGPHTARWSVAKLMNNMGWLRVHDLVIYHQCVLIHQIIHTGSPEYLKERLLPNDIGNTRSYAHKKLGPKPRDIGNTMYTKNSFVAKAFSTYNDLPSIITAIPVRVIFKKRLKRYLICNDDIPSSHDKVYGRYYRTDIKGPMDKCQTIHDVTTCGP